VKEFVDVEFRAPLGVIKRALPGGGFYPPFNVGVLHSEVERDLCDGNLAIEVQGRDQYAGAQGYRPLGGYPLFLKGKVGRLFVVAVNGRFDYLFDGYKDSLGAKELVE